MLCIPHPHLMSMFEQTWKEGMVAQSGSECEGLPETFSSPAQIARFRYILELNTVPMSGLLENHDDSVVPTHFVSAKSPPDPFLFLWRAFWNTMRGFDDYFVEKTPRFTKLWTHLRHSFTSSISLLRSYMATTNLSITARHIFTIRSKHSGIIEQDIQKNMLGNRGKIFLAYFFDVISG